METLNCVAKVDGWDVSITSGAHLVTVDQVQAALTARTVPGRVDIEVIPAGGSFGRRGGMSSDYVVECVRIAKRVEGRSVKLIWSREDDMRLGYFRPMSHHRVPGLALYYPRNRHVPSSLRAFIEVLKQAEIQSF